MPSGLDGSPIEDKAIPTLLRFPALGRIDRTNTLLTGAGHARLAAFPGAIVRPPEDGEPIPTPPGPTSPPAVLTCP